MKKFLHVAALAICTLIATVNANAQVITADRAQEIANSFFSSGMQKSAAVRSTAAASLKKSADSRILSNGSSNEAPTFHILTPASGEGFVIVSGEEIENPIIGYSFEGTIDTNNLPVGFVDYITDIDAQVKALRKYNAENPQKVAAARSAMQKVADFEYNATTMGNIVKNLNTAPWGQSTPFNNLCKTEGGQTALTGCGPTAFAILCYYYKWPASGVGAVTHQGTGENMELGHEYDYASMRNDNYQSGYNEAEANAVAVLMRDLGWANQVAYGTGTTSFGETAQHMVDHFRFKSVRPVDHGASLAVVRSTLGNDTQWKTYIKNHLNAGYPIPYASTTDSSNSARHIYILDGYTDNDYYHFNWGWNGSGNGWFTLDNMVPDNTSNYSNSHKAYYIIPDATTYTVTATVNDSNMGTVSINGGTAGSTATADLMQGVTATLTAHPADGYALASWTKNGVVVGSRNTIEVTVGTDANDYVANFDDEANVYVIKDYIISPSTVGLTGTSKESVVNYVTSDEYPAALRLASTATNGTSLSAMSRISDDQIRLYAYDQATSSTTVKYTLSVPDGYQITEYKFDYSLNSTSYPCTITYSEGTISPNNTTWTSTPVIVNNAQTAEFTISAENAHSSSNFYIKNFIVTVAKIGAGSGESTPTTYTINVTAGEGGTATVNGNSSATVTEGATVTLTATPNSGYEFVNWTLDGNVVSTDATCNVTVSQAANYVANFEEEAAESEPEYTQSDIRLTSAQLMSVTKPTHIAVKNLSETNNWYFAGTRNVENFGNEAVFVWTPKNEGVAGEYYLKTLDGKYLGAAGDNTAISYTENVNEAAVFTTLKPVVGNTGTSELVKDSNTGTYVDNDDLLVRFMTKYSGGTGDVTTWINVTNTTSPNHPKYYNGGYGMYTAHFVYAVSVDGVAPELPDVLFPDGAYKIYWQADNRGYLAYHATDYPNEAKLAGVTYSGCQNIHYAVDQVDLVWYLITADDGKRYLFQAATGKFLGVDTSIQANGTGNKLSTTEAWPIAIEENTRHTGHYIITTEINSTNSLLCSGCGTPKEEHPVRWLAVNDNNQTDGGAPLQLIPVNDVTVADNVMNAVLAVINGTDEPEQQTLNVTYSGATWNNEASSWWVSVVTNTTPAVTVKTTDGTPKIGYSTFNDVRHPYLLDGNSFTISVPANCKITGYSLGYKAHNLVSKSVTYTNGKQSTGTITIAQSNEENTLTVTGLDNNEISISVEDQSSQAGFIIKSLEITYVENEFEPAMFKAEIEGWRDNNPNTHLGTITIGGTAMKLTPAHQTASELTMPVVEGTALAFTRKYRGFEFNGFYIGSTELGTNPTLTAENVAAIDENNPLIAKFTATDDVTLFYDDDEFSYRIPAIAKTGNGMLVAVSDYRHNLDDIGRDNHGTGTKRVDLVMRTSTDNGATWSETKTIAAGDNSMAGSYQRAYGDAAIAAVGQNIVVMAAAGDVVYTAGTTSSPNKMARIYSTDNGATWTIEEMTTKMYSQSTSLIPSGGSAFFGSGKLAVDPNFNGTGNARIYGALLVRIGTDGYNNFGVFSDDLGATWKILGGDNTNPVAKGDEPKVEILPNGQILLSARRGGGRVFRVFTYGDDKANGAGSWGDAAVNGCDNGGSNATNGEIICLDAKRLNGKPTKILLQSQPKGGSGQYDRRDVTIWYKEVSADETYTSATIASDWTMGKQVSTQLSAYSTMCLQANGEIALFFEEAPCYGDDYTKGYSMVCVPLTIEEITNDNFLNPNADVEYVPTEFSIVLTDAQDNEYRETLDYIPGDVAAVESYLTTTYPFITLGTTGAIADNTYTNTVTLPFKVSNANTTVWHNIYWPSNGTSEGEFYPIYMMANADDATIVAKITEKVHYGNSQYNTYNYADKLGWAVYNVNNSFTFKFKNKLTGKFMAVNGVVSSGNASNVIFTDETNATAFTLTKNTGTTYKGDFAITSVYNGTTGYVCNTSAGYADATNYTGNGHHGAWAKIVESPDYWTIYEKLLADINNFGAGDGKYTENDAISNIDIDALASMPLNSLNTKAEEVQTVKDSYTEITLTVPAVNDIVPGSVKILDELVSHKFVPKGNVTIQAIPAAGYRFVNWTRPAAAASAAARTAEARNSDVVSTDNPYTVTVSEALSLVANFEKEATATEYPTPTGNTYNNNYLTSITTTGGDTNIDYSANAHPGQSLVVVPGKVQLEKGESFTMNLVAYSLGEGSSSVTHEDMRYCHASLFTDFDQDFTFQAERVLGWGNQPPTNNVYGNYDYVMNITHTIKVPDDAPTGESHVRMIYTNAWTGWPANGTAELDKGIVYDIVVEVVEKVDITANAGEGGSVTINGEATGTKRVIKGSSVTLNATPASGYVFANWTNNLNTDIVTENPYTPTVAADVIYTANFEQNVVNVTLTDAEGNTYEVQVSGFTAEITKDAVEEKLREAYPYITLGSTDQEGDVIDFGVLNIDGTAYTYTNMVELPFRVTNTTYLWHNIYWPSNTRENDYPVYLSALTADDIYVPKVTGSYAYGDHPTYNTKSGNNNISWAIYNVNNSFEFIFKNKVTQKYIKIINVATGNAQNVQYVENAEDATAFTIFNKPAGNDYYTTAQYALAAKVGETTGYLCSTSATGYNYATHYFNSNDNGYGHQGAWIEFVEAPDYYSIIRDQGIILGTRFGAGDGKCIITDEISVINNDIANNSDNITFNTLKEYGSIMEEAMNNWPAVGLTINPAEGGTTNINGEENVVHKYVPNGYALPLAAVPAEGYHFVNWTDAGGNAVSTDAATTITMSGNKGDVIEFTANFAINIYNINVTAGEGGSASASAATAEHGSEVTLTAVANDGYRFVNWTLDGNVVSTDAICNVTVSQDANYVANFEIEESQDELTTGYYHLVSRATDRDEHLYNNAFSSDNTNHFTLQSNTMVNTNNGIWHIEVRDNNKLGIVNGDGNPIVAGASNGGSILGSYTELTVGSTMDVGEYRYYYFTEALNCSKSDQAHFKVGGINYLTTWSDHPEATDNQWRLERVDTDGKNIYDVVVECTEQDVYVVYGSGTNEEYAFNGGFFITDATITAQQLTAKKNNADAEGVTVLVEGNTIRVVDAEYVGITVSATPAEGGAVTINGEAESTLQVVKSSSVTVDATPADGYHFVNWTDAGDNAVSTDATYTFTASESTSLVANFEADVVYHTITVSTFYDNGGGTVKVGEEDATSVNVADGESVRMLATVNEGYEFMGWLKDGVIVKNAIGGGLDFEVQGPDYTLYEIKASAEYVAVFSKITDYTNLEDGKAYRIRAVSESCAPRYIYREGTVLKWTNDGSNFDDNYIFVVQKNGNSVNLISAIGYHGWKASNILSKDEQYNHYAAIKVTYGTKDDTRSLYLESGTSSGIYTTRPDNVFAFVYTPSKSSLPITDADNSTTNFLFEEVDTYAFQVSVADGSNAKLGTINLPFATTIPEGVTAYSVDHSEDEFVYMAELGLTDNVLPANTPVLVEAEAAGKYGFKPAPASGDTYDTGFAGTLEAEDIPGTTNAYILSYKGVGTHIMLYKLSSTSRRINANKAYYIDETGKASSLRFVFGETTDIDDVEREDVEDTIYDLQGRKLSEITEPGFYIVNGKKIFVK